MPDISEERLTYLEALETVVQEIVLPEARYRFVDTELERVWKRPLDLTDTEAQEAVHGSALWDDPPQGWTKKRLADWTRGELHGREVLGMNYGQHFYRIIKALRDPVGYWKRWRLGYLDMLRDVPCTDGCTGRYAVDATRIGLVCSACQAFYTYEQLREMERAEASARAAKEREGAG